MAIPIMDNFNYHVLAKEVGLMIGIPNTLYCFTVSRFSTAYTERWKCKWIAWRETYQKDRRRIYKSKSHC
ncbi:hypothetical protein D8M04_00685 [Oceanobacillus piezotolerans]|uniref:Uncharacterized protein n=1 Tax=Oceanobacillus piezotolerans TaxID=2448030 RepID=A0A498DH52_9BACI|nr:hypothetical protein [Oceanobacillus piezotolerans]RLL47829.1 hypothetical protein D8M04_00685 [Oceanobacillus piezotolerans]